MACSIEDRPTKLETEVTLSATFAIKQRVIFA